MEILYSSDFINKYDYYLPICPENHMIYYDYVKIASEVNNINLSCAKTLLMTSDKLAFKEICNKKIYLILIYSILIKLSYM